MGNEAFNVSQISNEVVEEAYKVLKTNIQFCEIDKKIKVISITSYGPGEGKSTISLNLALTMSKSGLKVLLVDADLRKPMLFKNLGRNDFKGLSNYILGRVSLDEIINKTNIDGFYFITCGIKPINPLELIETVKFNKFLNEVREKFDMVIVDTPPLGSVIDCAVIAAQTDGTLIVIEQSSVKYRNALRVKEQLDKVNARILGVVLNKVSKADYKDYYKGYDYYGNKRKYLNDWIKKPKK